jgi:hypothetical protein
MLAHVLAAALSMTPLLPPLLNPERGFRMQASSITNLGGRNPSDLKGSLAACKQYNMTITLGYAYISKYWNETVLPREYLADLDSSFSQMRDAGVKVVLNVAYMDGKANFSADPEQLTLDVIFSHISQLAPVVRKNADVVHALQAGFIGNAGEWAHDIRNFVNNHTGMAGLVSRELYELLPPDRSVLIRRPIEKRTWLLSAPLPASDPYAAYWNGFGIANAGTVGSQKAYARLGYYNAGFLSNPHDGGTWSGLPEDQVPDARDPYFAYMTQESAYVPIDGEAYWGTPNPAKNRSLVTGHAAALRFFQHHYTTFSHHNSFWPLDQENTSSAPGGSQNKSLNTWMQTPLNVSFIDAHKMPMSASYRAAVVKAGSGATVYEYIRDHLGYRFEFVGTPSVALSAPRTLTVRATLANYGFATLANPRAVVITLQKEGSPAVVASANVSGTPDARSWQPHAHADPLKQTLNYTLDTVVALPSAASDALPAGTYAVGIGMPDPRNGFSTIGCCVRFAGLDESMGATALYWRGGVNVIGSIQLDDSV